MKVLRQGDAGGSSSDGEDGAERRRCRDASADGESVAKVDVRVESVGNKA